MNKSLLFLAAMAALAATACTQDKPAETTTAPVDTVAEVTTDTDAYRAEADRLAQQIAQDANLTDPTVVEQVKSIHYDRARRMAALRTHYAQDTTGEYAAMRNVNDSTSAAVQSILPSAQYPTYSANRGTYYDGPYTTAAAAVAAVTPTRAAAPRLGSVVKKSKRTDDEHKVKYMNGAKRKVSDDGDVKIKRADGTKIKIDENGKRTVKKPLF